jgi:putative oxidoreductase
MGLRWFLPSKAGVLAAFLLVVRLGLGFLFITSSVPKIRQPYVFLGAVSGYELVGPQLGVLVAMMLRWLELLAGACLVGGVFVGGAFLVSTVMGVLFTFVLASALWRHLDISCGCFSTSLAGKISYAILIRAIVIVLVSAAGWAGVMLLPPGQQARSEPESEMQTHRSLCLAHSENKHARGQTLHSGAE